MSLTHSSPWSHWLCFFLFATTQARVALFDLLEYHPDETPRQQDLVRRQQQCTEDLYLSVLSAQPSGSDFCYTFDTANYDTITRTINATATTTQFSASTTYTRTRHPTITSTVTASSAVTATSYVFAQAPAVTERALLQDRQVNARALVHAIIQRQLSQNGSSIAADSSILSSVSSALSSGCNCLLLANPTFNSTVTIATMTEYANDYAVQAVTESVTTTSTTTIVTTIMTYTSTVLSSTTTQGQTSTIVSSTAVVQSTESFSTSTPRPIPVTEEITCPDSNNGTNSVVLANYRYDYFFLCDTVAQPANSAPFNTLMVNSAADCAAACSEVDYGLIGAPCKQWTYNSNHTCNMYSDGDSYIEYPGLVTGVLLRVAMGSNSTNASDMVTASQGQDTSAVLASVDSSITHVNPPAYATSDASSSCWTSATTYSGGAYSYSWACYSTSSWYQAYATTYITTYQTTTTIIKSVSGGSETYTAGDQNGSAASGSGGGMIGQSTALSATSGLLVTSTSGAGGSSIATPSAIATIMSPTVSAWNSTFVTASTATGISISFVSGGGYGGASGNGGGFASASTVVLANGSTSTSIMSSINSGETVLSTGGAGGGYAANTTLTLVTAATSASIASGLSTGGGSIDDSDSGGRNGLGKSSVWISNSTIVTGSAVTSFASSVNSGISVYSTGGSGSGYLNVTSNISQPSVYITIVTINTTTTVTSPESSSKSSSMSISSEGVILPNATTSIFSNGTTISSILVSGSSGAITISSAGGGTGPPSEHPSPTGNSTASSPLSLLKSGSPSLYTNSTYGPVPNSGILSTGIIPTGTGIILTTSITSDNGSFTDTADNRTPKRTSSSPTRSIMSFTNTTSLPGTSANGTGAVPMTTSSVPLTSPSSGLTSFTNSTVPSGTGTSPTLSTAPSSACSCPTSLESPTCVTSSAATVTITTTVYPSTCETTSSASRPPGYGPQSPPPFFTGRVYGGQIPPAPVVSSTATNTS